MVIKEKINTENLHQVDIDKVLTAPGNRTPLKTLQFSFINDAN